ncbi:TrbC/VirB2 family protein [Sandaracinobacteroides saxicola]|uniref:TrbC/VirB2 family protein n=1 Tax=Sandaracinobacteroides saxicola TaxID=2759707 RepID=A0A7G5IGG5_9SPHN|nr:TrbC/VirB2 family protein [Sandaracinobacteroides saxicola]QMW22457.1 TrbC/VirB2 family protein [Sandaracinobacteroides saxicola]
MTQRLTDPPAASVLLADARWIEALLTGPFAVALGTISIALVGLAMLGGHVSVRRAGQVLLGCVLLFGAPQLARGLREAAGGDAVPPAPVPVSAGVTIPDKLPRRPDTPSADPYAGASVPPPR